VLSPFLLSLQGQGFIIVFRVNSIVAKKNFDLLSSDSFWPEEWGKL
jgi:hypothetical protein